MRKHFLLILFIFAVSALFAQTRYSKDFSKKQNPFILKKNNHQQNLDSRQLISIPQNSIYYSWDADNWKTIYQNEYQYDGKGYLTMQLMKSPATGENCKRLNNYFDQNNHDTLSLLQVWHNGTWIDSLREINRYDQHNNNILHLNEIYAGNTWVTLSGGEAHDLEYYGNGLIKNDVYLEWTGSQWLKSTIDIYTYNSNNQILVDSLLLFDNGVLTSAYRTIYHYNKAPVPLCDTMDMQEWNGESWGNNERIINIVWKTPQMDTVLSYTDQQWAYQSYWENNFRLNNTILADSVVSLEEYYNTYTTNWELSSRETVFTDSKKNNLGVRYETWDGDLWQIEYELRYSLAWNGVDIIEKLLKVRDLSNPEYQNVEKYSYSNFLHLELGAPANIPETVIKIYPNPGNNILYVQGNKNNEFVLYDLTGREVVHKTINESAITVNTSSLNSGIYFYRFLKSGAIIESGKWVKK